MPVGSPDSVRTTAALVESDASDARSAGDAADATTASATGSSVEVGAAPTDSDVDRLSGSNGVPVSAGESAAFGASAADSARTVGSDIAADGVGDSGCDGSTWSGMNIPSYGCARSSRNPPRSGLRNVERQGAGSTTRMREPGSATAMVPPCRSTIQREMARPRPVPPPSVRPPRVKRSKMVARSAIGMPGPWS